VFATREKNQQPDKAVHPQMTLIKIQVFPSAQICEICRKSFLD